MNYRCFTLGVCFAIINLLLPSLLASSYDVLDEANIEISIETEKHLQEQENSHRKKLLESLKKYLPQKTSEKDLSHLNTGILEEFCTAGEIAETNLTQETSSFSIEIVKKILIETRRCFTSNQENSVCLSIFIIGVFVSYILEATGVFTFIHEYVGHLLLGGGLLTTPSSRFNIEYPSPYYQVDGFDDFIGFKNEKSIDSFVKWFFTLNDNHNDTFSGYAFPSYHMTNKTTLSKRWGEEQSGAWISLSGSIPLMLLSLQLSYLLGKTENDILNKKYMLLLAPVLFLNFKIFSYSIGALNYDFSVLNKYSDKLMNDFISWSYFMGKYLKKNSNLIAIFTSLSILFTPAILGFTSFYNKMDHVHAHHSKERLETLLFSSKNISASTKFLNSLIDSYPGDKKQQLLSTYKTLLSPEISKELLTERKEELYIFFKDNFTDTEQKKFLLEYLKDIGYKEKHLPNSILYIKNSAFILYLLSSFLEDIAISQDQKEAASFFYSCNFLGLLCSFFDITITTNYYYQQDIKNTFKMHLFMCAELISYTLIFMSSILNSAYYDANLLTQIWGRGYVVLSLPLYLIAAWSRYSYIKQIPIE